MQIMSITVRACVQQSGTFADTLSDCQYHLSGLELATANNIHELHFQIQAQNLFVQPVLF